MAHTEAALCVSITRRCQPFLQRYPDVSLNVIPQESPLLEEWLSAQRYDIGLTETQHAPAGTDRLALLTCDEVCVFKKG